MVVAAHAKSDAAITAVGNLGVRDGVEVKIDDIVKCTNDCRHLFLHQGVVLQREVSERQTGKVAHDKVARLDRCHHHRVAALRAYFRRNRLYGRHVLCNLRTQVGAINHSFVAVRVGTIHYVTIECKWGAGLNRRP